MSSSSDHLVHVGTLERLRAEGCVVVRGADRSICVWYNEGNPVAVDNRCPHMGFPLSRGSIHDGIITCHWHHARFDAASGCTFDLFADDVPAFDVQIRDQDVYVQAHPRRRDPVVHARRRLTEGMQLNLPLTCAKAILDLRTHGVGDTAIVQQIAEYGAEHRDGWGPGMTVLTCVAQLLPDLGDATRYEGLYQAARRVAADCAGQPPRQRRRKLDTEAIAVETMRRWLHRWTQVRHRDGAERTLLTLIGARAVSREQLNDILFDVATVRHYADTGHLVDFANKAMELLQTIGGEHARTVLPTMMGQLASARGGEEMNAWRDPVDLIPMVAATHQRLPGLFERGRNRTWRDERGLADRLLGDDPQVILDAIAEAVAAGARPAQLSKSLAWAGAVRVARFGTSNEQSDWISALHSFSYGNAVDQVLCRSESLSSVRGVLHGAMSVYLNRFLNVPAASLPAERGTLDDLPRDASALCRHLLEALDGQHQVDRAARIVARYLALDHDAGRLVDTLTHAVLREDFDFHSLQMVEAGVRQFRRWGGDEGRVVLIAVARYLAAHSPTPRAQGQTARIARRLCRGEFVYEDDQPETN